MLFVSCCSSFIFLLLGDLLLQPRGAAAAATADNGESWSSQHYEVWGSDQSNSVADQDALGVRGSWLWIWNSEDIADMLQKDSTVTPPSRPCSPDATTGPCDLDTIFPGSLTDSASGETLSSDVDGFGRYHGITKDPQNKYVTANIFAPGGGYVGIIDTETKGAVGLFRVTEMTYSTSDEEPATTTRNVHMSFWNGDGSAILVHNLAGKAVERINVEREDSEKITSLTFDKSATVGLGKAMEVASEASFFQGNNAFGVPLLGAVQGSYDDADLGDLTPSGLCKESGCPSATANEDPGRPNNVGICPIVASNGLVFNTLGGGGLLILDSKQTPMTIVGAYGNSVVFGAGVCGAAALSDSNNSNSRVFLTSGVSASGAGADQSMFTLYAFDPNQYSTGTDYQDNLPAPVVVYDDDTGTATGGKTVGDSTNDSGQVPGTTTRRDAHDLVSTIDGKYVHVVDRIKNVIEVFDSATDEHVGTYDLTTATGDVGDGTVGPCSAVSVADGGEGFPINDPAPDFIDPTPDGKYMMISFRGPAPVSAGHAAQGSCPGVGIVELKNGGASGSLVGVLRSTNTVPDSLLEVSPPGGVTYTGEERSDVHDVVVIFEKEQMDGQQPGSADVGDTAPTSKTTIAAMANMHQMAFVVLVSFFVIELIFVAV